MFECMGFLLAFADVELEGREYYARLQGEFADIAARDEEIAQSVRMTWNNGQAIISIGRSANRAGDYMAALHRFIDALLARGVELNGLVTYRDGDAGEESYKVLTIGNFPIESVTRYASLDVHP